MSVPTQQAAVERLLDIAKRRKDDSLMNELIEWVATCVRMHTTVLDLERPAAFYSPIEQVPLRRSLARSFADGMLANQYDSYVDGQGGSLVMKVLMIEPAASFQRIPIACDPLLPTDTAEFRLNGETRLRLENLK